jgi:DNA modification methylase
MIDSKRMPNKITIKKQRAPRNQTLQVSEEEYKRLIRNLLSTNKPFDFVGIKDKTILGDTMQILDLLPQSFADLIIIDPPYNLTKNFSALKFRKMKEADYLDYLRSWFPKVVSLLRPNGSLYICGDWKCTAALFTVMNENLTVLNRISWQREKGKGAMTNWKNGMEDIWFGVKDPKDYYFDVDSVKMRRKVIAPYRKNGKPKDWEETPDGNFRMTHPSNFWDDISIPYWSMPENTDHPTQKPEKLIAKLILASCPKGGFVFDPFLGSGTTSVVAKKLNRHYCGVEMNPEYACWAEKRLEQVEQDPGIQGYNDGVFWERNSKSKSKIKNQ